MLLERDPSNAAPAEEAFGLRFRRAPARSPSFGLRGALALAKLYHATGHDAEAHTVLAPPSKVPPTPEMPESPRRRRCSPCRRKLTDDGAAAQRRRLTQLHVVYGDALVAARAMSLPKQRKPLPRPASRRLTRGSPKRWRPTGAYRLAATSWRLASDAGARGGLLRDVEARPEFPEAGSRIAPPGSFTGSRENAQARDHFEGALALFQPGPRR